MDRKIEDYIAAPPIVQKEELVGTNFVVESFSKPFTTKYGEAIAVTVKTETGRARILIPPDGPLNDPAVINKRCSLMKLPSSEHPGQSYFLYDAPV